MKDELDRRATLAKAVLELFRAHPLQWLEAGALAEAGGFCAWRSRVSDARQVVKREGGDIVWNKDPRHSCYRYHPQAPQGRDAGEQVPREWTINGPFTRIDRVSKGQQGFKF